MNWFRHELSIRMKKFGSRLDYSVCTSSIPMYHWIYSVSGQCNQNDAFPPERTVFGFTITFTLLNLDFCLSAWSRCHNLACIILENGWSRIAYL